MLPQVPMSTVLVLPLGARHSASAPAVDGQGGNFGGRRPIKREGHFQV